MLKWQPDDRSGMTNVRLATVRTLYKLIQLKIFQLRRLKFFNVRHFLSLSRLVKCEVCRECPHTVAGRPPIEETIIQHDAQQPGNVGGCAPGLVCVCVRANVWCEKTACNRRMTTKATATIVIQSQPLKYSHNIDVMHI